MLAAFYQAVSLQKEAAFFEKQQHNIYFMNITSLLIGLVAGAIIALAAYILIRRSILKGKRD